ncbi:hypothetical protein P9D39_16275 [Heyndrickxia oleronia]|uniref:Uncharacterized protein n=1 Tax=Heyndrickxia oleronia TaxID=38875 RepID=A0A8E2I6P4_9BACI|nr:hypothetical protein [Heyndrickxia oleronia]MEC1375848.1 hypothetical protein [Heyndrickxia oleronia]OOP67709.1 hypothetical protein BWZ43_14345 [Heyndrickxia oleronia]QQZ05566.1 hypothetical protein I5818_03455 [Heyndrickxia oleronia]
MSSNFRRNRTNSYTNKSTDKRTRNQNTGMIVEDNKLPVRILNCKQGNQTQYGTKTLKFTFQHLVSKEEFTSTIFEDNPPNYIDQQILNAVLPPDVNEYLLNDLIDKGLIVEVKFRTRGANTYINIVKADPLNKKYQTNLDEMLEKESLARQELEDAHNNEDEIDGEDDDGDINEIDID